MSTEESDSDYAHIRYTPSPEALTAEESDVVWVCPYCGERGSTATEIRSHISESGGAHVGLSGTSPTRDIVAFSTGGEVESVIEGQYNDLMDGLSREHGHKKRDVVNLWLVGFPDVTVSEAIELTDASENYVRTLFNRLQDDDVDASELQELKDPQLQERLGAELEALRSGAYPSPRYAAVGEQVIQVSNASRDDEANTAGRGQNAHDDIFDMNTTNEAAIDETLEEYTGKQVLYNLYALAPTIHYTAAARLAGVSEEHARRNIKALTEGDVSADELDAALDVDVQRALYARMEERGQTADSDEGDGEYRPSIKTEVGQIPGFEDRAGEDELEPPSFGLEKQAVVANAMRAEPSLTYRDVALVADCSAEYARTVMREIENHDISPRRVQEMLDEDVQARITEFVAAAGLLENGGSDSDSNGAENRVASGTEPQPDELVEFDTEIVTAPTAKLPILEARDRVRAEPLKRVRVINAWLAPGERSYADAGRMAGSSSEHARRTYRQIEGGDITPQEIREAADRDLINALLTLEAAHVQGQIDLGSHDLEFDADLTTDAVPEGSITYVVSDTIASRLSDADEAATTGGSAATEMGAKSPTVDATTVDSSQAPRAESSGAESRTQRTPVARLPGGGRSEPDASDSAGPEEYLAQMAVGGWPERVVPAGKVRAVLDLITTLQEFSEADPHENVQRDWVLDRIGGELESLLADAAIDVAELENGVDIEDIEDRVDVEELSDQVSGESD